MPRSDDIVSISPEWPYRVEYDLRLGDNSFDRRVISDIENEKPHIIVELELPLDLFQFLLRPSRNGECEGDRTGPLRVGA